MGIFRDIFGFLSTAKKKASQVTTDPISILKETLESIHIRMRVTSESRENRLYEGRSNLSRLTDFNSELSNIEEEIRNILVFDESSKDEISAKVEKLLMKKAEKEAEVAKAQSIVDFDERIAKDLQAILDIDFLRARKLENEIALLEAKRYSSNMVEDLCKTLERLGATKDKEIVDLEVEIDEAAKRALSCLCQNLMEGEETPSDVKAEARTLVESRSRKENKSL
jgi:hypothetical protein